MQINFENNSSIRNFQIGNNNTMYVERDKALLQDNDWMELQQFIDKRLDELVPGEKAYIVAQNTREYIENKDESGLKGFIRKNKDTFFTNVLSDLASSGLILAISRMCM